MGRSVVRVSEKKIKKTFGTGLQILSEPQDNVRGPYCEYGARGECLGVNDLDYVRCYVLNCSNCLIYQIKEQKKDAESDDAVPISDPLTDTVVMHENEIVSKSSYDDSIHDQIADGKDVRTFFKMRNALRTGSVDYRVD